MKVYILLSPVNEGSPPDIRGDFRVFKTEEAANSAATDFFNERIIEKEVEE